MPGFRSLNLPTQPSQLKLTILSDIKQESNLIKPGLCLGSCDSSFKLCLNQQHC